MDGKLETELELVNKRLETLMDIVLEHFGANEDRLQEIEDKLESRSNAD